MVHEYHWDELQDKDEYIMEIEPEYEWCEDEDPSGNIVHEYGIEDEQTMLQKTSKEKIQVSFVTIAYKYVMTGMALIRLLPICLMAY